jgi:hypothetical protein
VNGEAALDVVKQAEVLARLLNLDHVYNSISQREILRLQSLPTHRHTHEASRVVGVGADLAIDSDEALGDDGDNLSAGESVLEAIAEENLPMQPVPSASC